MSHCGRRPAYGLIRNQMRSWLCKTSVEVHLIFHSGEVGDGVVEVKATGGDSHLGGRDIDQEIVAYIKDQFKRNWNDLTSDSLAM